MKGKPRRGRCSLTSQYRVHDVICMFVYSCKGDVVCITHANQDFFYRDEPKCHLHTLTFSVPYSPVAPISGIIAVFSPQQCKQMVQSAPPHTHIYWQELPKPSCLTAHFDYNIQNWLLLTYKFIQSGVVFVTQGLYSVSFTHRRESRSHFSVRFLLQKHSQDSLSSLCFYVL